MSMKPMTFWNFVVFVLCLIRGLLAGLGAGVAVMFFLINIPGGDPTSAGAFVVLFFFIVPILMLIGVIIECYIAPTWYYD